MKLIRIIAICFIDDLIELDRISSYVFFYNLHYGIRSIDFHTVTIINKLFEEQQIKEIVIISLYFIYTLFHIPTTITVIFLFVVCNYIDYLHNPISEC